jgi:nucleotide-binding universal stress UspA family protein
MKTFKNIVVATDFSDASLIAYHYAQRLASRFQANLKVVHAFQIFINAARPELTEFAPSLSELQTFNEERMAHFISETHNLSEGDTLIANKVKVTTEVRVGFAAEYLIEISEDPSVDLLVLGTAGEKNWFDRLLGSVSVEVSQGAHCPVLLVPQKADFQEFSNILYGVSDDSAKPHTLRIAVDWAKYFKSYLHFVHVETNSKDELKEPTRHFFNHYIEQYGPSMPHRITSVKAESAMKGIWHYSSKNDIDLVVVVSHHRDFWAKLNHHSVSKDLSLHTRLPILYLYSDAKRHPPV